MMKSEVSLAAIAVAQINWIGRYYILHHELLKSLFNLPNPVNYKVKRA